MVPYQAVWSGSAQSDQFLINSGIIYPDQVEIYTIVYIW